MEKKEQETTDSINTDDVLTEKNGVNEDTQTESITEPEIVVEPSLEEKFQTLQNEYLYLRAEFDNYRKRVIKERSDLLKFGSERLVVQMLDVIDNFDRSLELSSEGETLENFKSGIQMISKELKSVLDQFGVREVPCEQVPFDPNIHEAIGSEESEDIEPGYILKVFKKPYRLHDRLIRPGQVIVAKELSKPKE